jgi:Tfp pilus assembly protein PilV
MMPLRETIVRIMWCDSRAPERGGVMRQQGGFTVVEVLIAVILLEVGVLALVGGSALVLRLLHRGAVTTQAAWVALNRLERLGAELAASPSCSAAAGSDSLPRSILEAWSVLPVAEALELRQLSVTVTYPVAGGSRSAILATRIRCP